MSDLISSISSGVNENQDEVDEEEEEKEETDLESTSPTDIDEFNKWAKTQASKDLSKFKKLTNLCDIDELRSKISSLNYQQRRLFDDYIERAASSDIHEE